MHWPAQIRRLTGYNVYALDLSGHGKSEGRGRQSIDAYVGIVLDWMESMKLHQSVFVGHSMGGAISQTLALNHPEKVVGLGLVGTGGRLRVAPEILENTSRKETLPAAIDTIINWAFSSAADPQLVELSAKRMAEIRHTVLHGDFTACDAFDVMDSLSKITAPTLVLCGGDDKLTPVRYSQYLADHIPNAEIKIIPSAGHMVMLEKPEEVRQALLDFLSQVPYIPGEGS